MEITLDVRLFKRHDLRTEEVFDIELSDKLLLESCDKDKNASKSICLRRYILFCTISKANNGLSVPEQTVTTRNGFSPRCSSTLSNPRSIARPVMSS